MLRPQMWRSWMSVTPGRARRAASTAATSIPSGTASIARSSDSRSRPQVVAVMMTTMARLETGSIQVHPVSRIAAPERTTPAETAASAADVEEGAADV